MSEHIHEQVSQYLDNELAAAERAKFEAHLAACADCRREVEQLRALDRLVKVKDEPPKLAADYWDWHRQQVWRGIRSGRRRVMTEPYRPKFAWFKLASLVGMAAVLLVVVIAGWRVLLPGATRLAEPRRALEEPAVGTVERGTGAPATGGYAATKPTTPAADRDQEQVRPAGEVAGRSAAAEPVQGGAGMGRASGEFALGVGKTARDEVGVAGQSQAQSRVAGRAAKAEPPAVVSITPEAEASVTEVEKLDVVDAVPDAYSACDQLPRVVDIPQLPTVDAAETSTVLIRALVELTGRASKVLVDRSSGNSLLDSIAARNVRQAEFEPGVEEGQSVRCWLRVAQRFAARADAAEQPAAPTKSGKPDQQPRSDDDKSDRAKDSDRPGESDKPDKSDKSNQSGDK